jgi:GDP-L-fucose synthase
MAIDSSSRIFVAGGSGMVGSAVVRRLLSSGYTNVIASYRSRSPVAPAGGLPITGRAGLRWVQLDLTRQNETEAFFEKERPRYVVMAAAKVGGIVANNTYRAEFIYDNMAIASHIVRSSHRTGVQKLLNLGASCIYPRLAPQPLREEYLLTGPLEPTNEPYAIAKIAAIKLCRYFNEQYGTNYLSLVPTNLYGPEDNFNLETSHLLPALIRKFHLGKLLAAGDYAQIAADIGRTPFGSGSEGRIETKRDAASITLALEKTGITAGAVTLWGTGRPYREFLHVDDLSAGVLLFLEYCDAGDVGEFVNIGAGEDRTIDEIARLVKETVGFKGEIVYDATKPDGMPRKVLDVSRMAALGWRPSIDLGEGIRRTYEWYTAKPSLVAGGHE